jgi:hypothetical protein
MFSESVNVNYAGTEWFEKLNFTDMPSLSYDRKLILWTGVTIQKLTVAYPFKLSACYGTRRFIIALARDYPSVPILSQINPIHTLIFLVHFNINLITPGSFSSCLIFCKRSQKVNVPWSCFESDCLSIVWVSFNSTVPYLEPVSYSKCMRNQLESKFWTYLWKRVQIFHSTH